MSESAIDIFDKNQLGVLNVPRRREYFIFSNKKMPNLQALLQIGTIIKSIHNCQ